MKKNKLKTFQFDFNADEQGSRNSVEKWELWW